MRRGWCQGSKEEAPDQAHPQQGARSEIRRSRESSGGSVHGLDEVCVFFSNRIGRGVFPRVVYLHYVYVFLVTPLIATGLPQCHCIGYDFKQYMLVLICSFALYV